jgi:hypothetical protein
MKNKILFHVCCGPCGTASIKRLQGEGYLVTAFYYNPNIHPKEEYKKRLAEAKKLATGLGIKIIVPKYNPSEYFKAIGVDEGNFLDLIYKKGSRTKFPPPIKRCPHCWRMRLEVTAQKAKELNIKIIGSTLRISPYQDQRELLSIGKKVAARHGVEFYSEDLTSIYTDSIIISKEKGMYRQKYCGCLFSKEYL